MHDGRELGTLEEELSMETLRLVDARMGDAGEVDLVYLGPDNRPWNVTPSA